jgi:hypothetical protein
MIPLGMKPDSYTINNFPDINYTQLLTRERCRERRNESMTRDIRGIRRENQQLFESMGRKEER